MSGGFFRGTSADQDTRFSNKQAKLLKSQKFAPELDHLVDMTKVKMDVIKPWIATRATELLGFEDEVLINFVYGLLDCKEVDGKKIQIQLTGFMEKNTGKFMKELWTLLLSAQNNVSGVPQQFLDAKEEEQRKKKEENDRITQEIQKRKERAGREIEREMFASVDGEDSDRRSHKTGSDLISRPQASSGNPEEERKDDGNHDQKARNGHSISPHRNNPSPSSQRSSPSAARSRSREIHKSGSASVYSESPRHSISPKKRLHSPLRRSFTPIKHYRSPQRRPISRSPIRRSPHSRRRSTSRSRDRYSSSYYHRSHARRRSPNVHRRSPSPLRRRSPSLVRRKSPPLRRRSPSPVHRRSPPLRRRSPSPVHRRSPPLRRRSPSPTHRRSPPLRRRSPSPVHRRSRSPPRHRSPIHLRRKSPSPYGYRPPGQRGSPSPARYESSSPIRRRSPLPLSSKGRKQSPLRLSVRRIVDSQNSPRQRNRIPSPRRSESPLNYKSFVKVHNNFTDRDESGRPYDERAQRRLLAHHNVVKQLSTNVGSDKSPDYSKLQAGKRISSQRNSRSISLSRSPVARGGGSISHHASSETSREEEITSHTRDFLYHKKDISRKKSPYSSLDINNSYTNEHNVDASSPNRSAIAQIPATRRILKSEIKQNDTGDKQNEDSQHSLHNQGDIEYGPGGTRGGRSRLEDVSRAKSPERRKNMGHAMTDDAHHEVSNLQSISKVAEYEETHYVREHGKRSKRKFDRDHFYSNNSGSDDSDNIEKQKLKRSDSFKPNVSDNSENDLQIDDKKEAKKKRREERRLRKEEKRRMREEKRRRRAERRAARQKNRSMDDLSHSSDFEKQISDADDSGRDVYQRKNSHTSNMKDAESEQKKLEIELRKRALESLRAKKAIND